MVRSGDTDPRDDWDARHARTKPPRGDRPVRAEPPGETRREDRDDRRRAIRDDRRSARDDWHARHARTDRPN